MLQHTFVFFTPDHCSALLSGLHNNSHNNLQILQNSAAHVLTSGLGPDGGSHHATFKVAALASFKVLLLVFECLDSLVLSYLADLFYHISPSGPRDPLVLAFELYHMSNQKSTVRLHSAMTALVGGAACHHGGRHPWGRRPGDPSCPEDRGALHLQMCPGQFGLGSVSLTAPPVAVEFQYLFV